MILVLLGSLAWAAGSVYGLSAARPCSPAMSASVPMLTGGAILLAVGTVRGEWGGLSPAAFSAPSLLAFGYLVVFGSIVAFTAYSWLITNVSPTLVATYAFVNPVVAVFLGWALGGEVVTLRTVVGAAVIVSGVVLITVGPMLWLRARMAE
jgi:drug/metabolite transporter (DMT)-like permease